MKKYYEVLGLNIDATQNEIEEAYNKLSSELNPLYNNNEEFFKVEYLKVVDAYNALSNKSKLGSSKVLPSNQKSDKEIVSQPEDEEFITVKISKKTLNNASNSSAYSGSNKFKHNKDKYFGRFFSYDDEYISGWTYFARNILNSFLSLLLIGLYMNSVTTYKRSRSLGFSDTTSVFWGIWGFLSIFLGFASVEISFFVVTIPHWVLWFKNGVRIKK